jgi:hypothetical protein
MNLESPLPEFDSEDSAHWRDFLKTKTGAKLFPAWLDGTPSLLAGGELNAILIRSGESRGWSSAAQALGQLAYPQPDVKPSSDEYPSLDDDSKWPKELGGLK